MRHVTTQMIADAINELGDRFDAHDVERRVLRTNPVAIANEILVYANSNDVLRTFSAQFSRFVDSSMHGQIRQVSKVCTANLGGKVSDCQQWEKLILPVVAAAASPTLAAL